MPSSGQNGLRRFVNRTSRPSTFRMALSTFVGMTIESAATDLFGACALGVGSLGVGSLFLQTPLEEQRPHRESSPYRDHQQEIAALQTFVVNGVAERQRNRRGRRVAEPLDVDDDLFLGNTQLLSGRQDDPSIGLVRDE